MIIFDFITQDEIDDLPDDDPQAAFVRFVRIAQRRLGERVAKIDTSDQPGWEELSEARHGFMNVVIAAAKKYEIEPFASLAIPRLNQFDSETHRQFKADLDHYLTQLLLDNSSRAKRDSVLISPELKNTIRTYLFHLRELIEKADNLDEAKRQILLRRLSEFEAELDKKRLNLLAVTVLAITIAGAPGALWSSADVANRLLTNILRVVGEAKIADDAMRHLPSSAAPMAITGPRPNDPDLIKKSTRSEMDDEIPFRPCFAPLAGPRQMPESRGYVDVLSKIRMFDDHERVILVREMYPGSRIQPSMRDSREYLIKFNEAHLATYALNKHGKIKQLEVLASDLHRLEETIATATLTHAPKFVETTLFSNRPVKGYARVNGWAQIRSPDTKVEDLTVMGRFPSPLPTPPDYPFPFSLELCYSPTSLPFLDAHRRHRTVNEGIWLMTAFLELPVFQPRAAFAHVLIDQKLSLVHCSAPSLSSPNETAFSDVSALTELQPIDHKVYFDQLGVGHAEFRVPNLASLHAAYCRLSADDQKRFLRASANLFDSANPAMSYSSRVVTAVSAIEALLENGERCDKCGSHTGIGKNFEAFIAEYVAPDDRILPLYKELYPSRSKVAHGVWRWDLDAPIFGCIQDSGVTMLVAWSAAKRGLINWLLNNAPRTG